MKASYSYYSEETGLRFTNDRNMFQLVCNKKLRPLLQAMIEYVEYLKDMPNTYYTINCTEKAIDITQLVAYPTDRY